MSLGWQRDHNLGPTFPKVAEVVLKVWGKMFWGHVFKEDVLLFLAGPKR